VVVDEAMMAVCGACGGVGFVIGFGGGDGGVDINGFVDYCDGGGCGGNGRGDGGGDGGGSGD